MAAEFGSYNFRKSYSYSFMTFVLRVDVRIPGWQRMVKKALNSIHGVKNFKMDPNGLVEVSGTLDPYLLLERIRKAGRFVEIVSLQYGDCLSYLYTPGHGERNDYRGDHDYNPYYRYRGQGGYCGDGYGGGGGMGYAACNGRSYGGYWDRPRRPSYNRPFAGLAQSLRPFWNRASSSPRWFWH